MGHALLKSIVVATVLAAGSSAALAQFSTDPVNLEMVSDAANEQVQSKIAVNSDGTFYVAWFDNRTTGGGYDVYMQRYDANGVPQWAFNGVLVADRTVTSNTDWDLDVDAAGNAIASYGISGGVAVSKIDSTGTVLWTTSLGAGGGLQPKSAVLSNGDIMTGWTQSGAVLQRLSSAGVTIGTPITITEPSRYIAFSDVQPGDNGSSIVLWIRGFTTSFQSNKWLYTQKYDDAGAPMWTGTAANNAVVVYGPAGGSAYPVGTGTYPGNGGSIQNGYQPTFLPDGNGGGVYAWYENVGPRTAYLQKVAADGTVSWPVNGLPVSTVADTTIFKIGAGLSYDATTGDAFIAWPRSNAAVTINGLAVQKILADGTRAWGDGAGVDIPTETATPVSFTQSVASGGGCYVLTFVGGGTASGKVLGSYAASDGTLAFTQNVCDLGGNKGRLFSAAAPDGSAIFSFTHGPSGSGDLYLGNVRTDGSQGPGADTCPADVGIQGGGPGQDGLLDNNDFIAFINHFFDGCE